MSRSTPRPVIATRGNPVGSQIHGNERARLIRQDNRRLATGEQPGADGFSGQRDSAGHAKLPGLDLNQSLSLAACRYTRSPEWNN